MGDFHLVKQIVEKDPKRSIGITTNTPQRPPPIPPPAQLPFISSSTSSSSSTSTTNRNPSQQHYSYHSGQQQSTSASAQMPQPRNLFAKPNDNKPPYTGRGSYPGQSSKNEVHASGMGPSKGPPIPNGRPMGLPPPPVPNGRLHNFSKSKDPLTSSSNSIPGGGGGGGGGEVENILREMTCSLEPLSEIAATPRKEPESKFSLSQMNEPSQFKVSNLIKYQYSWKSFI